MAFCSAKDKSKQALRAFGRYPALPLPLQSRPELPGPVFASANNRLIKNPHMKLKYLLALLLPFLVAFVPPKLKKVTISKNVTLSVPLNFIVMPDDGIAREYPAARKPLAVYTSPDGNVDISVNQRPSTFPDNDLATLQPFFKASIQRMFTQVNFLREERQKINGREYLVYEFVSTMADDRRNGNLAPVRKYTLIQYTFQKDQMLIFSFNAPVQLQKEWQETAQEIMASAVVK